MKIRRANKNDVRAVTKLFYDSITTVNAKDYSPEQIVVWSAGYSNTEGWKEKIRSQYFFVAEEEEMIVGFASLTIDGYLDFMFVHKNKQEQGIASTLLQTIEALATSLHLQKIWADVSITAKPFFIVKGFEVTEEHTKTISGIAFKNTIMEKQILYV